MENIRFEKCTTCPIEIPHGYLLGGPEGAKLPVPIASMNALRHIEFLMEPTFVGLEDKLYAEAREAGLPEEIEGDLYTVEQAFEEFMFKAVIAKLQNLV